MRTRITADELKEIFRELLEELKDELIKELKEELRPTSEKAQFDKSLVRTSEVCKRWGTSRTTLSKLIKAKKLFPAGKFGHSFTFRTSDVAGLFGGPVC